VAGDTSTQEPHVQAIRGCQSATNRICERTDVLNGSKTLWLYTLSNGEIMKVFQLIICLAVGFLASICAFAQNQPNTDNGYQPYGSFDEGHIDSVNTMNGNLILNFPVPFAYAQRGSLNPHYMFYLSSKNWMVNCVPDTQSPTGLDCQWQPGIASQCVTPLQNITQGQSSRPTLLQLCAFPAGVSVTSSLDITVKRTVENQNVDGAAAYNAFGYSVVSWDQAVHELYPVPGTADSTGEATLFESVDGTGYRLQTSNPGAGGVMNNIALTDRAGNQFQGTFPPPSSCPTGFLNPFDGVPPVTDGGGVYEPLANGGGDVDVFCGQIATFTMVTDPDGNVFNLAAGSTGTDTMGRNLPGAAPQPSGTSTSTAGCVSPQPISGAAPFTYLGFNGVSEQIIFCYANFPVATNFDQPNVAQAQSQPFLGTNQTTTLNLVTTIILPNQTKWTFNYDGYGEVTNVGLPLGGSISYTWTEVGFPNCSPGSNTLVSRAVASRTVNDDNGNSFQWSYQWGVPPNTPIGATITNTVTDPLNNDTVHVFTALTGQCDYYETRTQTYQGTGSSRQLLQQVDTTYSFAQLGADDPNAFGANNVFATNIQTTVYPGGKVRSVQRTPDPGTGSGKPIFGEIAVEKDLDWGQSAPGGAVLRETDYTYQWQASSSYLAANILDPPASVVIKDGSGTRQAETDYTYDEPSYLTTYSGALPQGVQAAAPNGSVRGNPTTVSRWLNTSSSPVVTHTNWYNTGEVYQSIDALGNATTHSYSSAFAGAYPTQTCDPLSHCISGNYDFNTGLLTSFTDQNGQTTEYAYDPMWRIEQVTWPAQVVNGTAMAGNTSFTFNDIPGSASVQRTDVQDGSNSLNSFRYFDGLGRPVKTQLNDPEGNILTQTTFDAFDRAIAATNPFRSTQDTTYGVTKTQYDALGRVTTVTHPDGSSVLSTYVEPAVEVQDEGNGNSRVTRISQADGLGRLTSVCEVTGATQANQNQPAACNQAIAATGFLTSYQYDALGNLTGVQQGGVSRSFTYDSLSRLLTAANPESGTTCYGTLSNGSCVNGYDGNNNLIARTRPAPNQSNPAVTVTTNYQYDKLNRLTSVTYSDGVTPSITKHYDTSLELGVGLDNSIGRLSAEYVTSPSGQLLSGRVFSYDPMGRVINNSQCLPQNCSNSTAFFIGYGYDLLGHQLSASNGQGITFSSTYDSAGRMTNMTSSLANGNYPGTLFSSATYSALGGLTGASVGSILSEALAYDCRGRVVSYGSVKLPAIATAPAVTTSGCPVSTATKVNRSLPYDVFAEFLRNRTHLPGLTMANAGAWNGLLSPMQKPAVGPALIGPQPSRSIPSHENSILLLSSGKSRKKGHGFVTITIKHGTGNLQPQSIKAPYGPKDSPGKIAQELLHGFNRYPHSSVKAMVRHSRSQTTLELVSRDPHGPGFTVSALVESGRFEPWLRAIVLNIKESPPDLLTAGQAMEVGR
jgi:YD repeat-containing protein